MIDANTREFIDAHAGGFIVTDNSASLGHAAHVEQVPVGFMTLATCPLILWLLDGTVAGFASAIVMLTMFACGLYLLSIGQKAHIAYDEAELSERPAIPCKLLGSFLLAWVIGLLATSKIANPDIPMLMGFVTFVLCLVAFGLDPMRDKGFDNPRLCHRIESERLCRVFDGRCEQILDDLETLSDAEIVARVQISMDIVMGLMRTVDFETDKMSKLSKPLSKLLDKMEIETDCLMSLRGDRSFASARRKYMIKMQAMADAFETRARQHGIAEGRNSFELQAELLFDRIQSKRKSQPELLKAS